MGVGPSKTTIWRRANPDAARKHREDEARRWRTDPTLKAKHYAQAKQERQRLKREVFAHYGGMVCACCGEREEMFLTLDHVNSDGAEQRRVLGFRGIGMAFYRLLKSCGYPEGYQVLCMNCNFGKQMNGGACPHQE